jgi:hypothetical protein
LGVIREAVRRAARYCAQPDERDASARRAAAVAFIMRALGKKVSQIILWD